MRTDIKVGILQTRSIVGDITYNLNNLKQKYLQAIKDNHELDIIIAGEMVLSGYSPLDMFTKKDYLDAIYQAINDLKAFLKDYKPILVFGDVYLDENNTLFNVAYVIQQGKIINIVKKQKLVNYDIFHESRYFIPGCLVENSITINNQRLAVVVCEDLWHSDLVSTLAHSDISGVISINASPYDRHKFTNRIAIAKQVVAVLDVPVIYVNIVGGVDGVVFDGQSFVMDRESRIIQKLNFVQEDVRSFSISCGKVTPIENEPTNNAVKDSVTCHSEPQRVLFQEYYEIIQTGLRDFITDNDFTGVIIGISGGIDSALSATLAVDTLGSDKVIAVSMPSKYTSDLSKSIIQELTQNLGIKVYEIAINNIVNHYQSSSQLYQNVLDHHIAWENLQSRVRGNILMAISNAHKGFVVLCNGNKSELASGYFTLYGDSCGAFNLLKDLYKTEVFELSRWRNQNYSRFSILKKLNIIPEQCILRAPSAELAPNQFDEAELMPYSLLDQILEDFIENNVDYQELLNKYPQKYLDLVLKLLKQSEYKRRQSAIGIKLKNIGFGKEWQFPITNRFKYNERIN